MIDKVEAEQQLAAETIAVITDPTEGEELEGLPAGDKEEYLALEH